jgi:hypothetical protein
MNVYKVYIHTEEDPHVSEVVVAAESKKDAEKEGKRREKEGKGARVGLNANQ